MYGVLLVAKYIIQHCDENHTPVSNLKLQKLLYFVRAEFLANTGKPCFPEDIEAWDFGPVVPEVYHKYKVYGSLCIPYMDSGLIGRIAPDDQRRINGIVDKCTQYTASQLAEITHRQTPWIEAYAPYTI